MEDVVIWVMEEGMLGELLPLVKRYQGFYEVEVDEERNRRHFERVIGDAALGIVFGAYVEERLVGFSTMYFPLSTLRAGEGAYMCDLFVVDEMRGKGIGRLLIERAREEARRRGYGDLWWLTARTNEVAQRLYDAMVGGGGGKRWELVRYSLGTGI